MSLNKYQKEVLKNHKGLNVVEATAGSGKTFTVEHLVALLLSKDPQPSLGVFTFSKNAANELGERISRKLYPDLNEEELKKKRENTDLFKWICTIHAFCYRVLRQEGYKFRVLSGKEEWEVENLIKDSLKELGDWQQPLKAVRAWINKGTINLVEPEEAEDFFQPIMKKAGMHSSAWRMAEIYQRYHYWMKRRRMIDFTMMQAKVIKLIRTDPDFCDRIAGMFDYVIVDEAQDTSDIQMEVIDALVRDSENLMLVGDVDQSMYAFRGATPEVLRREEFNRHVLPVNYRSTQNIIQAGERLIWGNYYEDPDLMKNFQPRGDAPEGADVGVRLTGSFTELEMSIAEHIETDGNPGDFYILSRTRAECASIHTALVSAGIPAINKSGGLLFGASHIRKVLAYARLACDYQGARDDLDILQEIANVATAEFTSPIDKRRHLESCEEDRFWIDCGCPLVLEKGVSHTSARYYGVKAIQSARDWDGIIAQQFDKNRGGFPTMRSYGASDLVNFVNRLEETSDDASKTLETIIEGCVLPWLAEQEGIADEDLAENGKVEDFALLLEMVEPGMSTEEFIAHCDSITAADTTEAEADAAIIGTFHWAKGAEREKVIVNLTRCPIVPPLPKPGQLPLGRPPSMSEERRLAFVGVTRAKEEVYLYASGEWLGSPVDQSPFIGEILHGEGR